MKDCCCCKNGEILVEDIGADLEGHDDAAGPQGYLDQEITR